MANAFYALYRFFQRSKWAFYAFLVLYILGLGFLATKLSFEEDISKLIPSSKKAALTNQVLQQLNFADKVVVLIEVEKNGDLPTAANYASEFLDRIERLIPAYIKAVQGKVGDGEIEHTLDFVFEHLPLFLKDKDYRIIDARLNRDSLVNSLRSSYKSLMSPSGIATKSSILRDPLGLTFLGLDPIQQLNINRDFTIENGYITASDKKHVILFITPQAKANDAKKNDEFVQQLYEIQVGLNAKYEDQISSAYYGTTVIAVANARQIKKDIQLTVTIAMGILLLILIFFYQSLWIPIVLFIPPALGALLGIGALFLLRDQVSAISLGIGAVLLGITLDYSLHILTHFRNRADIKALYQDVTKPILMSSLTTAVAFLCLLFLESGALKDLGLFAAISVVGASVMALVCIPQWLGKKTTKKSKTHLVDRLANYPLHRNKWVIGGLSLLLVLSFFWINRVEFDTDISKLNFQTDALKKTEVDLDSLLNHSAKSLYVVSHGEDLEQVLTQHNRLANFLRALKEQDKIISLTDVSQIVNSQEVQELKIANWNRFWASRKDPLQHGLQDEGAKLGFKQTSFNAFYTLLNREFTAVSLDEFNSLQAIQTDEFIQVGADGFKTVSSLVKVSPQHLAQVKAELAAWPNALVIDRQDVNETFLGNLKDNFNRLIGYSLLAVIAILWFFYKRLVLVLITLIPILLTWGLTVGLMGILGINFNIFNVIISTFIFGLGVDYSIFMCNGLRKEYTYGTKELPTYKTSILLSVITTILALGVLIFAKHPALNSISVVSILGVLAAMAVCLILQPLLFSFFITGRAKRGLAPLRIRTFIHGILLSAFYALGGMLLSLFSIAILPLIPVSKKKKMNWLHKTMSYLVTATLYGNPFVKKQHFNPHQEDFTQPAIIIANHSSALDTLTIGMVTHKVIYLVNDWVYKSPIFGLLARVAGFYPVSSGIDGGLDHLKEKVRQGYSLVVFPEARRAKTNKLGRFHKGAFFLSVALELDILPLYLHGNAEVMPKGDGIIHDGHLQVHIGERIAFDNPKFGHLERERTKKISQYFKRRFLAIRTAQEGAEYYRDILYSNYRYKEDGILAQVKADFQTKKVDYLAVQNWIPQKGRVLVVGESYGQLPVLLVAKFQDRKVSYYNPDPRKREIAQQCYLNVRRGVKVYDSMEKLNGVDAEILVIENQEWPLEIVQEYVALQIATVILLQKNQKAWFVQAGYREVTRVDGLLELALISASGTK